MPSICGMAQVNVHREAFCSFDQPYSARGTKLTHPYVTFSHPTPFSSSNLFKIVSVILKMHTYQRTIRLYAVSACGTFLGGWHFHWSSWETWCSTSDAPTLPRETYLGYSKEREASGYVQYGEVGDMLGFKKEEGERAKEKVQEQVKSKTRKVLFMYFMMDFYLHFRASTLYSLIL